MKNWSTLLNNSLADKNSIYGFNSPCSKENLKNIREFIKNILVLKNITDPEQNQIIVAVDEICTNSIVHGNKENTNKCIDIYCKYLKEELVIEIIDKGLAYNISNYKEPSIQQLINEKQKGSMGLMLVKRMMDNIEFLRVGDKNICRMVKKVHYSN